MKSYYGHTKTISIHALREEGDASSSSSSMTMTNFYPRPPRGGRPIEVMTKVARVFISIHALREEGDRGPVRVCDLSDIISIHALREEGDMQGPHCNSYLPEFLSTPSARRATPSHSNPAG